MATRACFYIGNPEQPDATWLGAVAFDGYPNGHIGEALKNCASGGDFRAAVAKIAVETDDFASPDRGGFPFPWTDDIFLTDWSYAWFDGAVHVTCFHQGWRPLAAVLDWGERAWEAYHEQADQLSSSTPVPGGAAYDRNQPDSIMIIGAP